MLEKPDLQDEKFVACLQNEYGLHVAQVTFLPLGVDLNAAVYRVVADDFYIGDALFPGAVDQVSYSRAMYFDTDKVILRLIDRLLKQGFTIAKTDLEKNLIALFKQAGKIQQLFRIIDTIILPVIL